MENGDERKINEKSQKKGREMRGESFFYCEK